MRSGCVWFVGKPRWPLRLTKRGVDRTTIAYLRRVAKEGALSALAASKPGGGKGGKSLLEVELEAANAEIARLGKR